ncbi:hypothetical protein GCM10010912_58340 [Paenibacillus albidus]|uniref:Uncharacterized protein n=1 Tax=Paenibacillus albidus TaxID=2041023 RepID=A0A917FT35_9BACL|nr:hypothetical protein GCM10010912_58340 [Paenibacillus albidus]
MLARRLSRSKSRGHAAVMCGSLACICESTDEEEDRQLIDGEQAALVLADPPYNVAEKSD